VSLERPAILLIGGPGPAGLAVVEALARTPAFVVLSGRPGPALLLAARQLQRRRHTVEILPYDAAWSAGQATEMICAAEHSAGILDVVVAGVAGAAVAAQQRGLRCIVVHPWRMRTRMALGLPAVPLRLAML
jgi:NAD(P)-dependent dehydrogenase (short-subunit alcohol dehydrogenase family)